MAIPVYLWLKDDGGADIKGSVDVQDREAIGVAEVGRALGLEAAFADGGNCELHVRCHLSVRA